MALILVTLVSMIIGVALFGAIVKAGESMLGNELCVAAMWATSVVFVLAIVYLFGELMAMVFTPHLAV